MSYQPEKIRDVTHAEWTLQHAREACLRGMTKPAIEMLLVIGAFYENVKLLSRARACDKVLTKVLQIDPNNYYNILDELNDLKLGPNEQNGIDMTVG